jgi:hypothetical protein
MVKTSCIVDAQSELTLQSATPEIIGQAQHALDVKAKVLYEYEKVGALRIPTCNIV